MECPGLEETLEQELESNVELEFEILEEKYSEWLKTDMIDFLDGSE